MKLMKVTRFEGETFPGMLLGGLLFDSRTGERVKSADSWVEITQEEFDAECFSWGITDED